MNIKVGLIHWTLIDKKCSIETSNKNYNSTEKVHDFEVDVLLSFITWGGGHARITRNTLVKQHFYTNFCVSN